MENQLNYEISNQQINHFGEKPNKSNIIKPLEMNTSLSTENQEKIFEKEDLTLKNTKKEESSNKKENDNDDLNILNSKEKI